MQFGFAQTNKFYTPSVTVEPPIIWVGQFPSENATDEVGSFLNWFDSFLFGQKNYPLVKPFSLIAQNPDSIWILNQGSGSIFQYTQGLTKSPHVYLNNNQPFPSLIACSLLDSKHLLFTDSKLNKVFVLDISTSKIKDFTEQKLNQPTGIVCSPNSKNVWVAETAAHKISVFNKSGKLLNTIGLRGTNSGEFNFPTFICLDNADNLYVVDAMNFRIQLFDSSGNFKRSFGQLGDATGYLARPKGIASDSFGHIYVVDALFHTVQIFNDQGKFLYNFGNQGKEKGQFWMPTGIYINSHNTIYIADTYNSRIQIFQLKNDKK